LVPVMVYVVVAVGLAVTVAPVVALNPVAGDQAYVVAPLAVMLVFPPGQIEGDAGECETVGLAFTVITCVVLLLPWPFVAVSVTV
jgi:hypothetical protein